MGRQLEKLEQIWFVFLISLRVSENSFTHISISCNRERDVACSSRAWSHGPRNYLFRFWGGLQTCGLYLTKETADPQPRMALSKPSSGCRLNVGQQRHLVILWFKYTLFS